MQTPAQQPFRTTDAADNGNPTIHDDVAEFDDVTIHDDVTAFDDVPILRMTATRPLRTPIHLSII